jgi:hypothetical protein
MQIRYTLRSESVMVKYSHHSKPIEFASFRKGYVQ